MESKEQKDIAKKLRDIFSEIEAAENPFAHLLPDDDPKPFGGGVGARVRSGSGLAAHDVVADTHKKRSA